MRPALLSELIPDAQGDLLSLFPDFSPIYSGRYATSIAISASKPNGIIFVVNLWGGNPRNLH
jgi:hypothetical protein